MKTNAERLSPSTASRPAETVAGSRPLRVLMLVENLPSPFDRRVWQEATTLQRAGHQVSIICPTGRGYEARYEVLDGIHIHRYRLPVEAAGAASYAFEYGIALTMSLWLSLRVLRTRGFDVIHACNPPDLFFLIGGFYKLFGKRFVFDHHDLNPELYEAKFGRRDFFYRLMLRLEYLSFRSADVSLATNESYRRVALERGRMTPDDVFVVRSGPSLERMQIGPADPALKCGRRHLVGYVGVMGAQEGIDHLLSAIKTIVEVRHRHDVHFGLVGGGTSLTQLKQLAVELGIDRYVTFTGRISDAEMLAMLNTADLCVNPDVANDMNDMSTMNKIMEYMALGKPIVQFDLVEGRFSAGGASLYARRNDSADFAEKILTLVDDAALRARMGALGRARVVDELAWDYEAPKLLAAYQRLGAAKGARHPAGRVPAASKTASCAPGANGSARVD